MISILHSDYTIQLAKQDKTHTKTKFSPNAHIYIYTAISQIVYANNVIINNPT